MNHSKFALVIAITCFVLILALIGGTWGTVYGQTTITVPKTGGGAGKVPKGDNAGCPVESGCINGVPIGLPATGAAPLQAELPWYLVLIPLSIASFGAFIYGFNVRKHRSETRS